MATKSKARQANKQITQETAEFFGINKAEVTEVVNFYTAFAAKVVKAGLYQGLSFPHFGKFSPKVAQIHYKQERKGMPRIERNIHTTEEV